MPFQSPPLCLKLLVWSFCLLLPASTYSQLEQLHVRQVDTLVTSLDLFSESAPLNITLTLDLKRYQREKYKGEYMPVHFLYQLNDTLQVGREVSLKARGKFRRTHCSLAPFWLDLRKGNEKNEEPGEINRIKVVTHCKGSQAYAEYVLKEYLCYQLYNILSPVSFRARLVRMTYVDTGRKNKETEGWAFMIEPEALLAERHNAIVVEQDLLTGRVFRTEDISRLALFQYMIGNVDYSVPNRHNVKILGLPGYGTNGYTPVPYDFDYTGLVNAHYAIPGEDLGISSVRERYYLGPCREEQDYIPSIENLNKYQEKLLQMVQEFEYLEPKDKKSLSSYLEDYFDLAANQKALIYSLQKTCR